MDYYETTMPAEYEVIPRKDKRLVDLISDVLPFGRLWYDGPRAVRDAIGDAEFTASMRSIAGGHTIL